MIFISRSIFVSLLLVLSNGGAESIKYLQWWDEYLPTREEAPTSLIYNQKMMIEFDLDLNNDGVKNDMSLCRPFKIDQTFNPPAMCPRDQRWKNYRADRPSGRFYGGVTANFLNVSDVTEVNKEGEVVPKIHTFSQDTVQNDGASPNLYSERFPHNITRALNASSSLFWADMTLFVVDPSWTETGKVFYSTEDAAVNFSSLFLWKKEDFINGGASAKNITFDATSNLMVDLIRHWRNIEDGRFVVQDGEQFWISEYSFEKLRSGYTISLNPLNSRWAKYYPQDCDLAINLAEVEFEPHEFTDVQAAGVYLARYDYMPSTHRDTLGLMFAYDNFQIFATNNPTDDISQRTIPTVDVKVIPSFAFDNTLQPIESKALFATGVSVNGSPIQVYASDQLDIRGVIIPEPGHVGKTADIVVAIGYLPSMNAPIEALQTFMLNSKGNIVEWNRNIDNLTGLELNVTLTPEYRVQILPVSVTRFKNFTMMDSVVLGCDERPITYTGILGVVGVLQIYYGYMLETGELVYSQQPIVVELLPDPVAEEPDPTSENTASES